MVEGNTMDEDTTSSVNLLSMKTYPLENNNLLSDDHSYKIDFDRCEKMADSENPISFKRTRSLRFIIAWSVVVIAVLLLIAFIVLFIKFSGKDDEDKIVYNITTTSPPPTTSSLPITPSSTISPSTATPSSSISIQSTTVTIHSTYTVEPSISTTVISSSPITSTTSPSSTTTVVTTSKPLPECLSEEFQCLDGKCIDKLEVCDGEPQCSSGEDEHLGCECSREQFRCNSGQCVDGKFRCDKVMQCKDRSDEMNCTGCVGFQCKSGECLWTDSVVCDQRVHCLDLSDEMNCNVRRRGFEQCKNGMWIRNDKFCNGIDDCFDNSDETDCDYICNDLAEMSCGGGPTCIVHQWKCDGHTDCPNGWDERNSTCGVCGDDEFKCSDHVCIPNSQVCDDVKQCSTGTDEIDCLKLHVSEDKTSSMSGVVMVKSSTGQFEPICSDVWSSNLTSEICHYFGHSIDGTVTSYVTLSSMGLSAPDSYMLIKDRNYKLAGNESVLTRFTSIPTCPSGKVVSVTCQPANCGERQITPFVPFIVGGTLAPEGQWPWVVSISLLGQGVCGGVIVSPRWILTAAHCIVTSEANYTTTPHYYEITAGSITRIRAENDRAEHRRVDKIVLHPNMKRLFNWITDWDLALLHIESPLQFGDYLQPICLPSQDEEFRTNSLCYLAGWGLINTQDVTVNYLREAKMRIWNDEQCAENSYNDEGPININSTICAGYHSGIISGCKGDSGSPLMCKDNADHWNAVGIMSYGTSGCDGQYSGRANRMAKVSAASDWIYSVIDT